MQHRTNLAGRIGRWSAHHKKTAIAGWLLFVVAAYMLGGAVGTKQLTQQEAGVGESGKASKVVYDGFAKADDEMVLISDARLKADSPAFHAAVGDAVGRLKATKGVDRVQSPYGDGGGISKDGHAVMVGFRIKGEMTDPDVKAIIDRTVEQTAAVQKAHPQLRVEEFGGGSSEEAFQKNLPPDVSQYSFLAKPFTLKQLVATVKETMAAE